MSQIPSILERAPQLEIGDLKKADVLLSKGHGIVSNLIAWSDGGSFSHGALWSGRGIIQATSAGVTHAPLVGTHGVYRKLHLDAGLADAIVRYAESQLSRTYAYVELVLLALLFSSGLRVKGALLTRALHEIGGERAENLSHWLDQNVGKGTRVCTELVASCFFNAADGRGALEVWPYAARPARPAPADDAAPAEVNDVGEVEPSASVLTKASNACLDVLVALGLTNRKGTRGDAVELLATADTGALRTRKLFAEPIALDALTKKPIGVVTPADLELSPGLKLVGRIEG